MYLVPPKKGMKCNGLIRTDDKYCWRHKNSKARDRQVKYKEVIDELSQPQREKQTFNELKKGSAPDKANKKKLSNIVNRAIREVIENKTTKNDDYEEEQEEEPDISIEEPIREKRIQKISSVTKANDLSNDDLIDACTKALENDEPDAKKLLLMMLKRDIITDEEYDRIKEKYNI
jgi:hypothetical protein